MADASASLKQIPSEGLLDLFCCEQELLLLLGQTRQWTRMLRGQGSELEGLPLQSVPGYFVNFHAERSASPVRLEEWHFSRFADREGVYYAEGTLPSVLGADFADFTAVSCLPREVFLESGFLRDLLRFLAALAVQGTAEYPLLWDGLLYAPNTASFLLLPPALASFVAQRSPKIQLHLPYQLPLKGSGAQTDSFSFDEALSYALAVLFFRQVCGELPFALPPALASSRSKAHAEPQDEELLRDFIAFAASSESYVPASLFCPALAQPWDALLLEALANTAAPLPCLGRWQQVLQDCPRLWQGSVVLPEEPPALGQPPALGPALEQALEQRAKAWRRKRFWRRRGLTIGLCAAAFVLLLGLVYTPIRRVIMPPAHSAWTAQQVVEGYYTSMDALDVQQHGELVYRSSGVQKSDQTLITMLYVNSRTRQGYEGREVILPIGQWLAEQGLSERPSAETPLSGLGLDYLPYGISHLQVEALALPSAGPPQADARASFVARYHFWLPGSFGRDDDDAPLGEGLGEELGKLQPVHLQRLDRLSLRYHKQAWYIEGIQREEQQLSHPLAVE